MSVFGDDTLEELILGIIDEEKYTKQEILKALIKIAGYINHKYDDDGTMLK